jgi:hypothetical protein
VATGSPRLRRENSAERLPSTTAALRASDPHLASHPLTLSYSLEGGASWNIIAAGVTNSGSLTWDTPFTATLQGLATGDADATSPPTLTPMQPLLCTVCTVAGVEARH